MADNQKEEYSPDQIKQRDQINIIIEKASKSGKGITEIMTELNKKSFYFRHVVSIPLKEKFKSFIKSQFGIDIIKEMSLINYLPEKRGEPTLTREYLLAENDRLHKKLEEILEKKLGKTEEVNDLYRENKKLEKENQELKRKIK